MPYIGTNIPAGNYRKLTDISAGFNGSATSFQLSVPPGSVQYYVTPATVNQLLISVGGILQEPGADFLLNGSQIVFTTAPAAGLTFFGVLMGDALNAIAPSDGTVTTAKLLDGAVTTIKLADGAVATAKLDPAGIAPVVTSLNGGPLAGTRNRIINGAMAVDQRNAGAAQTFTAAAALAYSVDRWYGYCTGANVTGQRVQGASVGQFRYRFTGAASVTAIGFGQRIEQLNSAVLAGTTATLSVDLANSLLTSVTWTAFYANTADTFGTLASPTRTQIATGTFTVSSTVTRYSTQISVPAAATTGIEIVFTVGAQTSGTWTIGDVQLESGAVSTPFERRAITQELTLCQRYYMKTYNTTVAPGALNGDGMGVFIANNGGTGLGNIVFPVEMRAVPTCLTYSYVTGATGVWTDGGGTSRAVSVSSPGTRQCYVITTVATANSTVIGHLTASIEL